MGFNVDSIERNQTKMKTSQEEPDLLPPGPLRGGRIGAPRPRGGGGDVRRPRQRLSAEGVVHLEGAVN